MQKNNKNYAIAVIDIGKTNKKIMLFSPELKIIYIDSVQIAETTVGEFLAEDIAALKNWILRKIRGVASQYPIKVISVATFGATVVLLNENGNLAFPVISYNQEPNKGLKEKFLETFGSEEELYLKTGTPLLGQLLNVGVQLFWLKEKYPQKFFDVKHLLFLPQYIGYLLSGKKAVERTSLACHTYLYDFVDKNWSKVARNMDIMRKFPARFLNPWDVLGNLRPELSMDIGMDKKCKIAVGLHDSSASILPYLVCKEKDFVLASTGTCCEFMYPDTEYSLSSRDFKKNILYYLAPTGRPIKVADFKGGEEHEYYGNLIKKKFNIEPTQMKPNRELLRDILVSANSFIIPAVTPGYGLFAKTKARIIGKGFHQGLEIAYHLVNLSLAIQSYFAIRYLIDEKQIETIFVEGGFRRNNIYLSLLAALFPKQKVIVSNLREASSLGIAICGKCAYEGIAPGQIEPGLINFKGKLVKKLDLEKDLFGRYISKFKDYCMEQE